MPTTGAACEVRLEIAGREVAFLDTAGLHESLDGSGLRVRVNAEAAASIQPGDELVLTGDPGTTDELRISLWVTEVTHVWGSRGEFAELQATDLLSMCSAGRHFGSHSGSLPLHDLVQSVLSRHPAFPQTSGVTGPSEMIRAPWLLQCDETAREFLQRQATAVGCIVYPGREGIAIGRCGRGPVQVRDDAELRPGIDIFAARISRGSSPPSRQALWIDPASREVRSMTVESGPGPSKLSQRCGGAGPPVPAGCRDDSVPRSEAWLDADTVVAALTPGSKVRIRDRSEEWLIDSIDHVISAAGAYRNHIRCLPASRWGQGRGGGHATLLGPFQATVSHNEDPLGLGRLRVILTQDPERRPTPWLPFVTMAAGKNTGWHCLPDVDDLVMLTADGDSPEDLCGLGSIRGRGQPMHPALRPKRNRAKGFRHSGEFVIMTDGGTLRLTDRGFRLEAKELGEVDAGERLDLGS